MMTRCKYIEDYLRALEMGRIPASREMLKACRLIRTKFNDDDVFVDNDKIEKAIELIERYFEITLFDWEKFIIALVHCYYRSNDTVVFTEFLIVMGRGNGKNGFISGLAWYLTTQYHGIEGYNVDIIANSEAQAETSFQDIYEMLDKTWSKSKKFFYKTKEKIVNLKTKSYILYNTSNARTKDGKRSACLIFDEIHEYENSSILGVFRSGFGKRKHSRVFYITTNGFVRDGVFDERMRIAQEVLNGENEMSRLCPLIYKLDNEAEADNPEMWVKANPSLPYLPTLKMQIEQEWAERKFDEEIAINLFTKRFNLPKNNLEIAVTDYENIIATNRPLPDLSGWECVVGIDYAALNDFAAVDLHFKRGNERYDINHAWLCMKSADLSRIKAPWQKWADQGHLTVVNDVSIDPELIAEYIVAAGQKYVIRKLGLDNFRLPLIKEALLKAGFDANDKTRVKLIRPGDIMQVEPLIQECFSRHYFTWGDVPHLRWAANNTKRERRKIGGVDTGNFIYAKIEPRSRKTDPFMALVAAMCCEDVLNKPKVTMPPIGAIAF